jgi:FMN reductase
VTRVRVLAIDGSPTGGGRTSTVLDAVLAAARAQGATGTIVSLAPDRAPDAEDAVLAAAEAAEAFVVGSPVYRASYAAPLKGFLDRLPRGMWGEATAPFTGRAVAIVATGATWHHFLALDELRSVLAGFFAAHVVPPGLYVPREGFGDDGALAPPAAEQAGLLGRALVELAHALAASDALRRLRPQA